MRIHVKPPDGRVLVTAPYMTPLSEIEMFVRQKEGWIRSTRATSMANEQAKGGAPTQEELDTWRARVKQYAPGIMDHWAGIMGVRPGKVTYRNMVSRWGSCNVKTGHITLNVQLGNHPPELLEYVIVHELCHLLEASHGPRFKALMTRYLPDWRKREKALHGGIRR